MCEKWGRIDLGEPGANICVHKCPPGCFHWKFNLGLVIPYLPGSSFPHGWGTRYWSGEITPLSLHSNFNPDQHSPSFVCACQLSALPESNLDFMKPWSFFVGYNYTCNKCNKYFLLYLIFELVLKAWFCLLVGANHGLDLGTVLIRFANFLWVLCSSHTLG